VLRHVPDAAVPWLLGGLALVVGAAIFCLVLAIFYRMGTLVGECLEAAGPPLQAYTLNLAGSLAGTLAFTALVFFSLPPWAWVLPVFAGLVYFSSQRTRVALILGSVLVVIAATELSSPIRWSPYYRITYAPKADGGYRLDVDHDFYQDLLNLGPSSSNVSSSKAQRRYYDFPFTVLPPCGRVLIVGAGTGNDVAAALRANCTSVDAVEIDPAIAQLGRQLHPEHPYDSTKVRLHINDGRAFFHQARAAGQRFDVVVFGLVDSQTALSVMSSLRLEFFLYSRESFEEAISLLDPQHGLFVVGFSIGWKDWVAQRIYHTLELANGREPLAVKASDYLGTVSFVAGPGLHQATARLSQMPEVQSIGAELARTDARPVRDDWPFLYQNPRSFPFVYLGSLLLVLIAGAYLVQFAVHRAPGASRTRLDWPMFFMGSAFLLVETKNLSQLSLLFGATWITNAVVFSSIFAMAIAANLIVTRWSTLRLPLLFALLWAALLLSYFVPFSELTQLAPLARGVIGGAVTALPVLFSSLIFAKMFQPTGNAANALGSNILGGLFGGALEALSIFLGIKAMALLAIAVYGAAALCYRSGQFRPANGVSTEAVPDSAMETQPVR
jgi:SAM-dependent methyltransferase